MTDINECQANPCDINSECQNTIGAFHCDCFPGFQMVGTECVGTLHAHTGLMSMQFNSHNCNMLLLNLCVLLSRLITVLTEEYRLLL